MPPPTTLLPTVSICSQLWWTDLRPRVGFRSWRKGCIHLQPVYIQGPQCSSSFIGCVLLRMLVVFLCGCLDILCVVVGYSLYKPSDWLRRTDIEPYKLANIVHGITTVMEFVTMCYIVWGYDPRPASWLVAWRSVYRVGTRNEQFRTDGTDYWAWKPARLADQEGLCGSS